jgi:hypothetical protein
MTLSFEQQQFLREQAREDLFRHHQLAQRGYLVGVKAKSPDQADQQPDKAPAPSRPAPKGAERIMALSRAARYAFGLPARVVYFLKAEPLFAVEGARERFMSEVRNLSGVTGDSDEELLAALVEMRHDPKRALEWLEWVETRDRAGVYYEEPVN